MTIDEHDIGNTVSVDLAAVFPTAEKTPIKDNRTQSDENHAERKESHAGDTQFEENVSLMCLKYTVDRIVCHVGKGNNVKYVLRWYGNQPADDQVELPVHIPSILILTIDTELGNKMKCDKDREKKIGDDKERMPPTVQESKSMTMYRLNSNRYPGCMAKL